MAVLTTDLLRELRGTEWRVVGARAYRMVRSSDLAMIYGGIVVAVAVVLAVLPDNVHDEVVLRTSTNLANLQQHPMYVLFASAFVVSNLLGLWMVPFMMMAYAAGQRWLGRGPTVVAAVIGHVGATLLVAVLLVTGIAHHVVDESVAHEPDVGISYAFACVAGLLVPLIPKRFRPWYVALLLVEFCGPALIDANFTDLGHTTALCTGFGLGLLATRAADAALRHAR